MRFFIFSLLVFSLFSCGRKRVITSQGQIVLNNRNIHWEIFTEHDTCFKYLSDNGNIIAIAYAAGMPDMQDSTFSEKDFSLDGKLIEQKTFLAGKPEGQWTAYYPNGKKKSISKTNNGTLLEYRAWYDNGQAQVNGTRLDNGKMQRTEFFRNGKTSESFETDSAGTGFCTVYFMNGKKNAEGDLFNFSPVGLWKRYDSLGNPLHDTLFRAVHLTIPTQPGKK